MADVENVVKYIPIDRLTKWHINPRTITDKALNDLKYKINKYKFFMEARPILVNIKKDKPNELIVFAGNQRLEAIKQLGWKEVPVVIFNDLTDEQQKELAIIDNHNDGEWNMPRLQEFFVDIDFEKLGFNVNFDPIKIEVPTITTIPTTQGKTEEIPVDNSTIKAEQTGYPVCNNEVPNYPQVSDVNNGAEQQTKTTIKVKCPHCGEEFEIC